MPTSLGMLESSDYNKGNPYFIEFRPLLHSQFKVSEQELRRYLRKEKVVLGKEEIFEDSTKKAGKVVERLRKHRIIAKKKMKKR